MTLSRDLPVLYLVGIRSVLSKIRHNDRGPGTHTLLSMELLIVNSAKNVQFCERFTFRYSLHFTEFEMGRIETKTLNHRLKQLYKINKFKNLQSERPLSPLIK
jgi:hypothetical protein